MAKKNTSIQINGKRYDALSGALLSFEETTVTKPTKSIDGVIASTAAHRVTPRAVKPSPIHAIKPRPQVTAPQPTKKTARSAAKHAVVKQTQPSQTLMRHAVSKPQASLKRHAKVQTATHHALTQPSIAVTTKHSAHSINASRAERANTYALHPRVSRFSKETSLLSSTIAHEAKQVVTAFDSSVIIPQTFASQAAYKPDVRRIQYAQSENTLDVFEQALRRATSHEQPEVEPVKERSRLATLRRRMVSFTAGAVAVLALVGFFGYQQTDSMQFRAAARQAGFSATLPGYQPRGYAFDTVKSVDGYVHLKYSSPSAGSNYIVSETRSDWNAQKLLDQLAVSQTNNNLMAVQTSGRTVYLYGSNQAAWVSKGVLYQVVGNGILSTQDFTQLASSM